MKPRAGVVGLGIMGSAYATHLVAAGFEVAGFDVDGGALRAFADAGGRAAASPRDVAQNADVVVTALATVAAVDAAYLGADGIAAAGGGARVVLDAGTFALDVKERVRDTLGARDVALLDAPVSGTGGQAQRRDLTVFASGDRAAYDAALPVMNAFARDVRYVGAFGNGSKLKYIANLLVTIHNLSTAEAVVLGQKAGIDLEMMLDVLGDSAASSRMFNVRGGMMAADTYEPAQMKLDVFAKDIGIIGDFAESVGCPTPLFTQSAMFYTAALAQGRAKQDAGAIAAVLKTMAGLAAEPPAS